MSRAAAITGLCAALAAPFPLRAQEASGASPTERELARAEAIRDTLTRPRGTQPVDAFDIASLPIELATLPLRVLVDGAAWLVERVTLPRPPSFPARALRAVRAWGASPRVGSIGERSGVALRLDLVRWEPLFLETGISIRGSQRHRVGIRWGDEVERLSGEPGFEASYLFQRDAEPRFWGIGSDTRERNESVFLHDRQAAGMRGGHGRGPLRLAGAFGYEDHRVDRGFGSKPDLQDVFDPLPFGAVGRSSFLRGDASLGFDFTHRSGFQVRGAGVRLHGSLFRGVDGTPSDFHVLAAEGIAYLPLNPRQLLAVRAFSRIARLDDGVGIPFYHLSAAGGENSLRAYATDRFRDRDAAGLAVEWRYEVWRDLHRRSRVELFLFFEEAGVARELGDLSGSDLRSGYGLGFRFVTRETTFAHVSLGFGGEGARLRVGEAWTF